jgi:hypothetical protein
MEENVENVKRGRPLAQLRIDWRIILKLILQKY